MTIKLYLRNCLLLFTKQYFASGGIFDNFKDITILYQLKHSPSSLQELVHLQATKVQFLLQTSFKLQAAGARYDINTTKHLTRKYDKDDVFITFVVLFLRRKLP